MERHSLYIDHQLVSPLIKELQSILKICCQELDQEYQTYELRSSIYEEFVFQITATFNSKYGLKLEESDIKDEELKKFYELTTKLEGINSSAKLEDIFQNTLTIKKGRPSKYLQAEQNLVKWINQKHKSQGITKFPKKDLDQIYIPMTYQNQKKVIPVNTYLKIFKKYQLNDIFILARGGKEKSVKDFIERNKTEDSWKKQEKDELSLKYENFNESELQSTSELESDFDLSKDGRMATRLSKNQQNQFQTSKRQLRSSYANNKTQNKKDLKLKKQKSKKSTFKNIFDQNSSQQFDQSQWDNNFSISNDLLETVHQNPHIYENSKSFE